MNDASQFHAAGERKSRGDRFLIIDVVSYQNKFAVVKIYLYISCSRKIFVPKMTALVSLVQSYIPEASVDDDEADTFGLVLPMNEGKFCSVFLKP